MVPAFHPRERGPAELLGLPFPSRGRRSPEQRGFGVPSPRRELPDPRGALGGRWHRQEGFGCCGGQTALRKCGPQGELLTPPRGTPGCSGTRRGTREGGGAVGPRGWRRRVPAGFGTPPTTPRCSKALWEAPCRNHPKTQLGTQPPCGHRCRIPRCRGGATRSWGGSTAPSHDPLPCRLHPPAITIIPCTGLGAHSPPGHAPLAFFGGVRTPPHAPLDAQLPPTPCHRPSRTQPPHTNPLPPSPCPRRGLGPLARRTGGGL